MAYFSIPYKCNGTNTFFNFTLEHDCVLFAGSRHLSISKQVCDGLITQLGKLGLTFIVGCCRDKAKEGHTVFISEYNAPEDFECIWQKEIASSLTKNTGAKRGTEKLFRFKYESHKGNERLLRDRG